MEHTFTVDNFTSEVLQAKIPVLVDFWAEWCGPCRAMGPIIEELAHEMDTDKIKIGKLNVDQNGDISEKYRIMSIPSFLLFKHGQVVEQIIGGITKEALRAKLEVHL